jgi:hypothetical protein
VLCAADWEGGKISRKSEPDKSGRLIIRILSAGVDEGGIQKICDQPREQ